MKKIVIALVLISSALGTAAQDFVDWGILADVTFKDKYVKEYGMELLEARFGDDIKQFDGQEVLISGYIIPIDPMGTAYVLSRNPNASCFFCGAAGPETIVGLRLKPEHTKRYKTDQHLTFKGTLKLNVLNAKQFTYMLLEAEKM